MPLKFVRGLAVLIAVFIIVGETVRRWHTWTDWPPSFFDDWIAGALLLYGAWRSSRDERRGQKYLVAAWAFSCGLGYASFFGHLQEIDTPDIGPIPHVCLTAIIGFGWLLCILALLASLRRPAVETP